MYYLTISFKFRPFTLRILGTPLQTYANPNIIIPNKANGSIMIGPTRIIHKGKQIKIEPTL